MSNLHKISTLNLKEILHEKKQMLLGEFTYSHEINILFMQELVTVFTQYLDIVFTSKHKDR